VSDITARKQAEESLQELADNYHKLFELGSDAIFLIDVQTGEIIEANAVAVDLYGYSREEISKMRHVDFSAEPEKTMSLTDAVGVKEIVKIPLRYHRKKDGTVFPVEISSATLLWKGRPAILPAIRDITQKRQAEHFQAISTGIQDILRDSAALPAAISRTLDFIKREMEFDAVGIRLRREEDFPYYAQKGFAEDFLLAENTLLVRDAAGDICRDETGNPCLECTCGLVLAGKTDLNNSIFTSGGSAWTNDSFAQFDIPADQDPRSHPRNRCVRDGYSSVALVPVRADSEIVGLLQLNDRKKDRFTLATIHFLEKICSDIGAAFASKRVEEKLGESEKRYPELVRDANVIIITMCEQGKITFVNEYGLSFFGYSAAEMIGKTEIETILPEYESSGRNLHKAYEDAKVNPQHYWRYTHENITSQNHRKWVDWTTRSTLDKETGETEMLCVGVDVTDAKRAEQEALRLFDRHQRQDLLIKGVNRSLSQAELLEGFRRIGLPQEPPFVLNLLAIPAEYVPSTLSAKELADNQFRIDALIESIHDAKIGVACQMPTGIVVVRSLPGVRSHPAFIDKAKWATDELIKIVSRYSRSMKITLGVSHSTPATQDIADLYEQARAALAYGPTLAPGRAVYRWHDLGYFQLIVKDLQSVQVRQFIEDHLGPVLNEKRQQSRATDVATLEALISGDSLQVIANRLHLHKHTIMLRKKKLEKMLAVDLDVLETRVNLAMALRMRSLLSLS